MGGSERSVIVCRSFDSFFLISGGTQRFVVSCYIFDNFTIALGEIHCFVFFATVPTAVALFWVVSMFCQLYPCYRWHPPFCLFCSGFDGLSRALWSNLRSISFDRFNSPGGIHRWLLTCSSFDNVILLRMTSRGASSIAEASTIYFFSGWHPGVIFERKIRERRIRHSMRQSKITPVCLPNNYHIRLEYNDHRRKNSQTDYMS